MSAARPVGLCHRGPMRRRSAAAAPISPICSAIPARGRADPRQSRARRCRSASSTMARPAFGGFAEYYPGDGKAAFAGVGDPSAAGRAERRLEAAPQAMAGLADWLEAQRAARDPGFRARRGAVRADAARHRDGRHAARPSSRRSAAPTSKRNQEALREACAPLRAGRDDPGLHGEDERQQAGGRAGRRARGRSSPASSSS